MNFSRVSTIFISGWIFGWYEMFDHNRTRLGLVLPRAWKLHGPQGRNAKISWIFRVTTSIVSLCFGRFFYHDSMFLTQQIVFCSHFSGLLDRISPLGAHSVSLSDSLVLWHLSFWTIGNTCSPSWLSIALTLPIVITAAWGVKWPFPLLIN